MPDESGFGWKVTSGPVRITMTSDVIRYLVRALQMIADECRIEERYLGASHQERALAIAMQALQVAKDAGYSE